MKGNVYILIHEDDLAELPPPLTQARYTYELTIFDQDGEPISTETVVPNWEQLAGHTFRDYGDKVPNFYDGDGEKYYVIEFETSFVKGEIQQLLAKSNPANFPKYVILSASEARRFLTDGEIEQ